MNRISGNNGHSKTATLLEECAAIETFQSQDGEPFATLEVRGSSLTCPLRSADFADALRFRYFKKTGESPGSTAITDTVDVLAATSKFGGKRRNVFVRVGQHEGKVYYDLCDEAGRVVEVDGTDWRVTTNPPCRFYRSPGMKPLPAPVKSGATLESLLRPFVHLKTDADMTILCGWIIGALRPVGPFAALVVHGEHGTAKSTLCNLVRSLIDPNVAPLRGQPRCEDDFTLAAKNSWVLALDNMSSLPEWLSDVMCRVSSGGGVSKRQLYSDTSEVLFRIQRPQILNGIEELATRGDLVSRSLWLELMPIASSQRRTEREFWKAFESRHGEILGAALNAVSAAIRNLDQTHVSDASRLSDLCQWVSAASPALNWTPDRFERAYKENREAGTRIALEASPFVPYLVDLVKSGPFSDTASKLLSAINARAQPGEQRNGRWPKTAQDLSNALTRLRPSLAGVGVSMERHRANNKNRDRIIRLAQTGETASVEHSDSDLPF